MFRDGFGEEQVIESGRLCTGYDRIVPNYLLDRDRTELVDQWTEFQPVVDVLGKFQETELMLATYDSPRDREFEIALRDGTTTMAVKAVIDGYPQYFPSPEFFQQLQKNDQSIVRFTGNPNPRFANIKIDTRDNDFERREPELDFNTTTFKRKYTEGDTLTTDFVTAAEGLVGARKQGYNDVVTGTVTEVQPFLAYVADEFTPKYLPFDVQTIETGFYHNDTVIAGSRVHSEHGEEMFITKQGFEYLANQNLAVVRAECDETQTQWTDLSTVFHPEMIA